jgi:hypothetical protein
MGFPEDFKIPVSDTQAYRQFGNSVVVPVVELVARGVVASLRRPLSHRPDLVLKIAEGAAPVAVPKTATTKRKLLYKIPRKKP